MHDLEAASKAIRGAEAGGRDPFYACRFIVPALLLSACIAAGASTVIAGADGAYYLGLYSDLSTLVAGDRATPRCAPSRTGGAGVTAPCRLAHASTDDGHGL